MLEARTHASTFVDHRFGETASHLTPEEKALERFTAERQSRLNKKTKFNLDDGADEGEIDLTHGGRKLGFGDEDHLEDGGWGGAIGEGGNREPLMNRRKMGAEPEEEQEEVHFLSFVLSYLSSSPFLPATGAGTQEDAR
jgi:nucleolar protein 14